MRARARVCVCVSFELNLIRFHYLFDVFIDFIYSVDFHLVATARRKVAPQRRKEGRKEGRKEKREGGRK